VKKELRHAESQQQGSTGEFSRRTVPKCEDDFLVSGAVDLRGPYACHEIPRGRDACLEFGKVRLGIAKYRGIRVGQQSAGEDRVPVRLTDLTHEIVHIGIKARIEENRGIYFSSFGVSGRMVEQIGQIAQKMRENPD
jgi:hypothetical protein